MKIISLQMPESLLKTTRRCAKSLHISQSIYIRRAIEHMDRQTQVQLRHKRLTEASKKVSKESLRINREFVAIEHAPDD